MGRQNRRRELSTASERRRRPRQVDSSLPQIGPLSPCGADGEETDQVPLSTQQAGSGRRPATSEDRGRPPRPQGPGHGQARGESPEVTWVQSRHSSSPAQQPGTAVVPVAVSHTRRPPATMRNSWVGNASTTSSRPSGAGTCRCGGSWRGRGSGICLAAGGRPRMACVLRGRHPAPASHSAVVCQPRSPPTSAKTSSTLALDLGTSLRLSGD